MKIHSSIFLAALFAAGCAAPKLAPLNAGHPAYAGSTSAPLAQPAILNTYRPAIETRATPNKNTFPSSSEKSLPSAGSTVDHAAMGHGVRGSEEATRPEGGAPPASSAIDHAAMGHGDAKPAQSTSPKPAMPAKQPSNKGGHDGH